MTPELIIKDGEVQIKRGDEIIWRHKVEVGHYARIVKMAQQILHALC